MTSNCLIRMFFKGKAKIDCNHYQPWFRKRSGISKDNKRNVDSWPKMRKPNMQRKWMEKIESCWRWIHLTYWRWNINSLRTVLMTFNVIRPTKTTIMMIFGSGSISENFDINTNFIMQDSRITLTLILVLIYDPVSVLTNVLNMHRGIDGKW